MALTTEAIRPRGPIKTVPKQRWVAVVVKGPEDKTFKARADLHVKDEILRNVVCDHVHKDAKEARECAIKLAGKQTVTL